MLKKRLITAFTLGPLLLWGILSLPSEFFAVLMAIFLTMGAYEWAKFLKLNSRSTRIAYSVLIFGLLVFSWWSFENNAVWLQLIFFAGVIWWFAAFVFVFFYPRLTNIWNHTLIKAVVGVLVLVPCWIALVTLHMSPNFGPGYALFVIMLMWMADSGAYFGGHRWGKTKLAKRVSPGKTIEGVGAALVVTLVYTLVSAFLLGFDVNDSGQWLVFVMLSLFVVLISVLGDLTESMFKRSSNIKDSGSILPGHGGMLDRVDSLTSAAPTFLFAMILWKGASVDAYIRLPEFLS